MKGNCYSLLLVGLALLLLSFSIGCGQSQSAYQEGYKAGFAEGYKAGAAQSPSQAPPTTKSPTPAPKATQTPTPIPTPTPTPKPTPTPTPAPAPAGAISWDKAMSHVGERTTVYRPVIGATYASSTKGQPTFLNVGKNYPDPARFTVLIWGSNRSKFSPAAEIQYKGRTIYVSGLIEDYKGSAQIVVTSPSQIQIQ